MNIGLMMATVVMRIVTYTGTVSFDGGQIGISAYGPGWDNTVPRGSYEVKQNWQQNGDEICGEWHVKFKRDVETECFALQLDVAAASTTNREWSADGKVRRVPIMPSSKGMGGGNAQRFLIPLPKGERMLVMKFEEPTTYYAQDGRLWGANWFMRFGAELDRKVHKAGEEVVYKVRFSSPEGIKMDKQEPWAISQNEQWLRLKNCKDILKDSALDFTALGLVSAPAGKYGWLRSVGGHFEFAALPGVAQRFYGVNLCFTACYPEHKDADMLIERLVRCGYNTLRIHHHDDVWAHKIAERDKLDYLIAKAIAAGLYITTDLYVSRSVTWQEIGEKRDGKIEMQLFKTLVQIDEAAYANWAAFAKEFMEHVNPYTQRAYKDEPGMPLISLINEGNLAMGFDEGKANDSRLLAAWRKFLNDPNAKPIQHPWTDPKAKQFDAQLNHAFVIRATKFLRGIGVKALLTNDNNGARHGEGEGETPLYDYVDNHFYVDHPSFLETPWRLPSSCPNTNPIKAHRPSLFNHGYARGASKPYAITEWNFSGPGRYRALGGILTGALAARDEWDGLWRFAYSHDSRNFNDDNAAPGYFDCSTDPLSQASDRATVCLFLRGDANSGTLITDDKTGSMTFTSPLTSGGFTESGTITAGPLQATIKGAPAALWATSLDGKPLADATRILFVHLTDVQGEGNVYADTARQILLKWGHGCLVENGSAEISLIHSKSLTIYALAPDGTRLHTIPTRRNGDAISFILKSPNIYYEAVAQK